MPTFTSTLTYFDVEYNIEIDYSYIPGSHGHCDKYGAPEEPDIDPEIEINHITNKDNGEQIDFEDLPQNFQDIIIERCFDDYSSRQD